MISLTQHERLLERSVTALVQHRFDQTSLDSLLEGSGVARESFLAEYGSKERLVDAVLEAEDGLIDTLLIQGVTTSESSTLGQAAQVCLEAIFGHHRARPDGFRLLFGPGRTGPDSSLRARVRVGTRARIHQAFSAKLSVWLEDDHREQVQGATVAAGAILTVGVSAVELADRGLVGAVDARHLAGHTVRNVVEDLQRAQAASRRRAC